MPLYKTNRQTLDTPEAIELLLDLDSFAGGENTIGTDRELKKNEARVIKNWEVSSLGGMKRGKGLTEVIIGEPTYTAPIDLSVHHFEGSSTSTFFISGGALLKKNSAAFSVDAAGDATGFTTGILSHAVSAGSILWITNTTNNLKKKTVGVAVTAPTSVPPVACERIYEHPTARLVAEGNSSKTIYGSMVGVGNWSGANAWTTANDAWSITMPDITTGAAMGFPSGNDITAFTKFDTYVIYNLPNVARRKVLNGVGCWNGFTVARGNEGIYFFSTYPTLGIFLWDGTSFNDLTLYHDFKSKVSLSNRMFGTYRDHKYYFFYNESNSGVTTPNRCKIYNALFGRWSERPVNAALADGLGYPCILHKDNNELYVGSTTKASVYELEDSSTSDNGDNTEAIYKTKNFSSIDFGMPVDNIRMKLIKAVIEIKGVLGNFSIYWGADKGRITGSMTFNITSSGDLINSTFIINQSEILTTPDSRLFIRSFSNSAIGRSFYFDILNSGTGARPEISKIRITAIALEDY